jgi:two-component sensor histidine kinase
VQVPRRGRDDRIAISGPDIPIATNSVSPLALLVYEFTINAAKYCSLSTSDGRGEIRCFDEGDQCPLVWNELVSATRRRARRRGLWRSAEQRYRQGATWRDDCTRLAADRLGAPANDARDRISG